jgi:hypothetical protein
MIVIVAGGNSMCGEQDQCNKEGANPRLIVL